MGKVEIFFRKILKFFKDITLWQGVAATVIGGVILWLCFKQKPEPPAIPNSVVNQMGPNSVSQTAVGDNVNQVLNIDKSRSPSGGIYIERIESGATVNINVVDYQDGVSKAEKGEVRKLFKEARAHYAKEEFREAIEGFARCLDLEEDSEKRGALNLQIGNCYYEQQKYLKAAEFYAAGLRESRKAKDLQGEASNLASIANTYMLRPASGKKVRGDNVRKAVEQYNESLKVFNKDEYPVDYAGVQNNLGNAYAALPLATSEERARNVRAAIECYRAAMEIYKKDEYPVDYAMTQNNLGDAYAKLPAATAEEQAKNIRAAIDCYRVTLEIRRKDEYPVDYAGTQNNMGNAYVYLPATTPEEQAKNIKSAIDCYRAALEIWKKDEYPFEWALTQYNLGVAYANLPAATAEERAGNIKEAIDCYRAALEIHKKDEYPQDYCQTAAAANLGLALASINNPDACYWLKEAYALREYLEDQGKRLEEVIQRICKKEQE